MQLGESITGRARSGNVGACTLQYLRVLLQRPIGHSRARCLVPQPMPLSSGKPPGKLRCEAGKVASRPAGPSSETFFLKRTL